jgi:N-acetylglucosamine-6-phosphate deacetylase
VKLVPTEFIDLQINGYVGKDFSDLELSPEDWHTACEQLRQDGLTGILAAFPTGEVTAMAARLARLVAIRERDPLVRDVIWGVHIEGPFLNPQEGYAGAHAKQHLIPGDVESMSRLLDASNGLTRIVTLAPECDAKCQVTRFLADQGVIVSAGHCNPNVEFLRKAIDAGLSMFTHLGNGCPMQMHRHDNIIQRVLSLADRLWITFIGDGAHIPYPALGNYLRCAGLDRVLITTDAMAAAGMPPGRYQLHDRTIELDEDCVAWAPGKTHLIGGAMTMPQMAAKMSRELGLTDCELRKILCDNARRIVADPN